jgi:hypothetical protein
VVLRKDLGRCEEEKRQDGAPFREGEEVSRRLIYSCRSVRPATEAVLLWPEEEDRWCGLGWPRPHGPKGWAKLELGIGKQHE